MESRVNEAWIRKTHVLACVSVVLLYCKNRDPETYAHLLVCRVSACWNRSRMNKRCLRNTLSRRECRSRRKFRVQCASTLWITRISRWLRQTYIPLYIPESTWLGVDMIGFTNLSVLSDAITCFLAEMNERKKEKEIDIRIADNINERDGIYLQTCLRSQENNSESDLLKNILD